MAARRSVVIALLAALLTSATPAYAAAADWPPHPDDDPFYAQPNPMPDVAPGTVLDSRPTTVRALAIPIPVRAWQLKYLSTDTKGEPAANVATVIQPVLSPVKRTLVSYQTAYDGLDADCAPSYAFATGVNPPAYEAAAMLPLLLAGHTVVSADYEGPEYQWTAGVNSGRGVLDGIRAAQNFGPAGLNAATPTALWGYSGGALASQWANEIAADYAPELNIVGVAAGGVPADIEAIARAIDGTMLSGVYFGATVGLSRAYPEIDLDSLLNDRGKRAFKTIGRQCIGEVAVQYAFRSMRNYVTVVRTYCGMGATVQYVKIPGEHISSAGTGVPGALAYVNDRLNGRPAPSSC